MLLIQVHENATVRNKETCVTLGPLSILLWPQAPFSLTAATVFMLVSQQASSMTQPDAPHSTDFSFPVQDTQGFAYVLRSLILRKPIDFFFSSLFHDSQMCVHRAVAFWVLSCRFSSCQPEPLWGTHPLCPHDHGALGHGFLKPALRVLTAF